MFSCEICEIFISTFFEEYMPTDVSISHRTIIVRIIFPCINERQREKHALFGKKRILISKPITRVMSASQKLQLLEFDLAT